MQELTDAISSLANGKAVEPDGISVELFKIPLNSNPTLRQRLLDMVARIWWGGEVPQRWKYGHHHDTPQKEGLNRARQLQGHIAGSTRQQDTAEDYRLLPQRVLL